MLIEVIRNGRRQRVHPKIGQVLLSKRIAKEISGESAESVAVVADVIVEVSAESDVVEQAAPVVAEQVDADELTGMDRAALLSMAEELGLKVHGRSGDEKIREIIREHIK